jgi:hypothetical protein
MEGEEIIIVLGCRYQCRASPCSTVALALVLAFVAATSAHATVLHGLPLH